MSVLPYQTIKELAEGSTWDPLTGLGVQEGLVWPCMERTVVRGKSFGLSHCGYDIRVRLPPNVITTIGKHRAVQLPQGSFLLASSVERVKIPNDLVAVVHDKSSWARMGLALQNTVLEPGWEGFITLEITTHRGMVTLFDEDPIAQILFHRLETPTEKPYTGKYQNQADTAVEAINEISYD